MSRSVVARVAMSRSASLSNMCSMISYPNGPAQEKDRPGLGYLLRLEWSPEVVVAYFVGWVVGYVGRLWSVTLARWFRASAGKRPKAGRFPPNTPPALSTGPHPPYPTRYDKGHTRDGQHPPPHSNATDKRRDIPTHPPQPKSPRWNATPGPNPASPAPLVAACHPSGDRANPPIPDQLRPPNGPSWNPTPGPNPASPVPLVAASSPQRGPRQPTDPGPTPATERTELEPDPGTQSSQSRAPRRRLVTPAGTAPTHRSRTNPGHRTDRAGTRPRDPIQPVPCPSSPPRHPSGDRANPPIPDQPGHRTARAGTPRRDPTQQPPELPPVRRIPDLRWPPATGKGSCPCVRAPSSRVPSSCRRVGSSGAKPVAELAKELRISESCLRNWLAGLTRTRVVAGRGRVVRRRRNWPSCAGTSGGWRLEILERAAAYFARRRSSARFDTARSPSMTAVSAASPFSRATNLMISRRLRS